MVGAAFDKSIRTGIIKNFNHVESKQFFDDAKVLFVSEISNTFNTQKHNLKVYTVSEATYIKEKGEDSIEELKHFRTKTFPIETMSDLKKMFTENIFETILKETDDFYECE